MRTILVVDDQDRIRSGYVNVFSRKGFRVFTAASAMEAYKLLSQEKIDLMLLDLNMPEVNGATLYEAARLFHREIKIIVSSVYPIEEQRTLIEGAFDYFDKSEGLRLLVSKVQKVFANELTATKNQ